MNYGSKIFIYFCILTAFIKARIPKSLYEKH